jgi:menaquinone-dependent protoporphyrinogen oxidase
MKVLVTTASEHGSTAEIGEWIAQVLRDRGCEVTCADVDEAPDPRWFDAVVLGSAVYAGRWMRPARAFVEEAHDAFEGRPVWLFSSGPIGDPPKPEEDPVDVEAIVASTGARAHRVFAGRLVKDRLGFGQRAIVAALRAPEGDYRDRAEIEAWAGTIADALAG